MEIVAEEIRGNGGGKDRIVALRHGHRWMPDYQKNRRAVDKPAGMIRARGVYLITGGLGNVGYVLGKYLLERYGATLVLTGRKDLSALRKEGLSNYQALRGISEAVYYYKADVSDLRAGLSGMSPLAQAVAETERRLGRINGVIHTAGIIEDRYFELVEDITGEKALAMLAPKVKGLENIYHVFRDRQPDFVWITSSLSTVLGGLGFSSYASANLYMDHFLWSKAGELPGWRSMDLGGMVFTKEDIRKESGAARSSLRPEELAALFDWSLGVTGSPVMVQTVEDLWAGIYRMYDIKKKAYLDDDREEKVQAKVERPRLSSAYIAPQTDTEKRLAILFENFFGIAGIGTGDNFFELGGDSLKAMMLLKRMKNEFDISITLTDFFQHDRIGTIAGFIDQVRSAATRGSRSSKMVI
jgi:NAD(P)-dependent dehydrogenase (short-subunit alcohol dehydrogenase family)/acyl carrier protein